MNSKRFESSSAVLRYFAAVLAIVAFALMFGVILYHESGSTIKFGELYFNIFGNLNGPHVYGFLAQLFTLLAGAFGVLIIVFEQYKLILIMNTNHISIPITKPRTSDKTDMPESWRKGWNPHGQGHRHDRE